MAGGECRKRKKKKKEKKKLEENDENVKRTLRYLGGRGATIGSKT